MKCLALPNSILLLVSFCFAQGADQTSKLLPHPVYQGGKAVYINRSGAVVLRTPFTVAYSFAEGLARFPENDHFGFMDETGRVVIKPSFDAVEDFSEGLAAFEVHDKWGFIDRTGRIMIPPQFDSANSFSEGLALVGMYVGDYPDGDDITNGASSIIKARW